MNSENFVCDPNDIDCCLNCPYTDCICPPERMKTVYEHKSKEEKEKEKTYIQKYQKEYRGKESVAQKELLLSVVRTELETHSPTVSELMDLTGLPKGTVTRIVCELIEEGKLKVVEG